MFYKYILFKKYFQYLLLNIKKQISNYFTKKIYIHKNLKDIHPKKNEKRLKF